MMDIDTDVQAWSRDWRRLRHQKHRTRGGVEGSMLFDLLLYEGEHQSVQVQKAILTRAFRHERDKNKLRLVINIARQLADRKIGRHWSIAHRYVATPNTRDPIAFDYADVIGDQLIPALDYKLGQETLRWQVMMWLVTCGVCFEHTDWKDGVTQEVMPKRDEAGNLLWTDNLTGAEITEDVVELLLGSGRVQAERFQPAVEVQAEGEVGADIYDPFRVFVDASVPQISKLGPDQAVYLCDIRSIDWIRDTFGTDVDVRPSKDLSIIETQMLDRGMPVSGLNLKDVLPIVQGSQDKDDPDSCIVITRYQPRSLRNPEGLRSFFVPDQVALDKGTMPYPEVPVQDYHWSAPGRTMWTPGFLRDKQSLQKFINKRFSQLGEAANSQLYGHTLTGGAIKSKDIPADYPSVIEGAINEETGAPLVQRMPGTDLPNFFPQSIQLAMETLSALGSSDLLTQRKFPGQMRGSLAVPMMQEILDSEDGPRFSHLAECFSREKMMRINRVKEFYPPFRTLNYTGEDLRHEVLEFHKDEILAAGIDFTITVDPGTLLPEFSAMREARVRERLQWAPGLYTSKRTGTLDWSKVAQDLKYNDRDRLTREAQARKLARQLIRWARHGKLTVEQIPGQDPQTGQPKPTWVLLREDQQRFIVLPFWDHNAMLDEYEAEMSTTEYQDASPMFKRVMLVLHDSGRAVLTQIDQARQASVENKMVQGAVAQASQQASAKAASMAVDVALDQVLAAQESAGGDLFGNMQREIAQLMGAAAASGAGQGPQPGRPPLPVSRRRVAQLPPGQ